jgi:hypothetical protein
MSMRRRATVTASGYTHCNGANSAVEGLRTLVLSGALPTLMRCMCIAAAHLLALRAQLGTLQTLLVLLTIAGNAVRLHVSANSCD